MMKPPRLLYAEEKKLINEYFNMYPDEEMPIWSIDEQRLGNEKLMTWLYEHASDLLKRYWDYRNWVGDERQLCNGKGRPIYSGDRGDIIQTWDIDEDGFCLYKGTRKRIYNTDGNPIKNPILDPGVEALYKSQITIEIPNMVAIVIEAFPEQRKALDESTVSEEVLGHIFASMAISQPMEKLYYSDKTAFEKYCDIIEELWKYGDDAVKNIVDVTILEDLNHADEVIWKGLGTYISEDFKRYINEELIHSNILMNIINV